MRITLGRKLAAMGTAIGLTALVVTPAAQADRGATNPSDCRPAGKLSQPFTPWGDFGLYTPVVNAGLEHRANDWTLSDGASVVDGNEPWYIGRKRDRHSLDLPAGASAVTSTICIDETYTHFRLFARNSGSVKGDLKIEVLYYDKKGRLTSTDPFKHQGRSSGWELTPSIPIDVFGKKTEVLAAPVAFRFTAKGEDARYQIDDVYVDPWQRG